MRPEASSSDEGEAVIVDARGLRCPLPVLRLRKRGFEIPAGTPLELIADDPAAARDVPAFAAEMGWACAQANETGKDGEALRWRVVRPA